MESKKPLKKSGRMAVNSIQSYSVLQPSDGFCFGVERGGFPMVVPVELFFSEAMKGEILDIEDLTRIAV